MAEASITPPITSSDFPTWLPSCLQFECLRGTAQCFKKFLLELPEIIMTIGIIIAVIITVALLIIGHAILTVCGFIVTGILIYGDSYVADHKKLKQLEQQVTALQAVEVKMTAAKNAMQEERDALERDRDDVKKQFEQFKAAEQRLVEAAAKVEAAEQALKSLEEERVRLEQTIEVLKGNVDQQHEEQRALTAQMAEQVNRLKGVTLEQ